MTLDWNGMIVITQKTAAIVVSQKSSYRVLKSFRKIQNKD